MVEEVDRFASLITLVHERGVRLLSFHADTIWENLWPRFEHLGVVLTLRVDELQVSVAQLLLLRGNCSVQKHLRFMYAHMALH